MNWLLDVLKGVIGLIRDDERRQEERRNVQRSEFDRMKDLTLTANNLYTGTFSSPNENMLQDTLMELSALARSQDDPLLEDAVIEFINAIRDKEVKNSVRAKTERVVKILCDNQKRI